MTFQARRRALAAQLAARELSAALVTDLPSVRYLTGFTGSHAAVVVHADVSAHLATDGRYRDQVAKQCPDIAAIITRDVHTALVEHVKESLGVQTHVLTVDQYRHITAHLDNIPVVALGRVVEELRQIKDTAEIASLRRACAISTTALEDLLAGPLLGRTEREVARDLEWRMLQLGAEGIGFTTIMASGPHSAIPHHQPTNRPLQRGDLCKIDFGARVDGYHADCTRTFVLGPAADWQREIYEAVREAQHRGVMALESGAPLAAPSTAVDEVLHKAGYREYFTTGLGHGVGLEIHEDPFLSSRHNGKVVPCMTLTVEPGIYLRDRGGVRIEDTVLVTKNQPETLTQLTTELMEL